jgi:hypothetical protein
MRLPFFGTLEPKNARVFYRQLFIILIILGGVLVPGSVSVLEHLQERDASIVPGIISVVASISLVTLGVAGAVYDYLRFDRESYRERAQERLERQGSDNSNDVSGQFPSHVTGAQFALEIVSLRDRLSKGTDPANKTNKDSAINQEILNRAAKFLEQETGIAYLRQNERVFRARIEDEIDALGRRGRVNLSIGAAFAVFGIAILGVIAAYVNYDKFDDAAQPKFL